MTANAITAGSVLRTAYNMLGDGQGGEWHENTEYTRAVIEFVMETVGLDPEIVDPGSPDRDAFVLGMIYAANRLEVSS